MLRAMAEQLGEVWIFFNELYYDARIHEHKKYVSFHVSPCLCVCVRVREAAKGTFRTFELLYVIQATCDVQK
jgi:hypothetical protein